jgi:hypothetical protein
MTSRNFALIFGILYLGLGILGMLPGMSVDGAVLGLFPSNGLLPLVHFVMGAWGLAAFMDWAAPQRYARSAAFIFAALGLMGMVHGLDTVFGLMPLDGLDVWLHLLSAGALAFVAWRPQSDERRSIAGDRRRASRAPIPSERRQGMYDRRRSTYLPSA